LLRSPFEVASDAKSSSLSFLDRVSDPSYLFLSALFVNYMNSNDLNLAIQVCFTELVLPGVVQKDRLKKQR
jgi:hypothetical protein